MKTIFSAIVMLFIPVLAHAADPLVAINVHGGLCPMVGECSGTITIARDGTAVSEQNGKPGSNLSVSAEDMAALKTVIEHADYDDIQSHKFTGTCPTAYDGGEIVYKIYTGHGEVTLPACTYIIDTNAEPFKTINRIHSELLTQSRS